MQEYPHLADPLAGGSWMRRKVGDSGSFLPIKNPQEPTLRSQAQPLCFQAQGHANYLEMLHQLLGLDFDDNVILRESSL